MTYSLGSGGHLGKETKTKALIRNWGDE